MRLRAINLDDKEDLSTISVEMTIKEACWIAKMSGSINNVNSQLHSEIYSCLVGAFFNKFYEDGVDEAQNELGVVLPKIEDFKIK